MRQTDPRPGLSEYPQKYWHEVAAGDVLPRIELPVSYQRIVLNAASTWDWFPGHHNPEYAKAQGQDTIYASTLFFHGFIDRLVTDWAGPETFITRRAITIKKSVYAGDMMYAQGSVSRHYHDEHGAALVDINVELGTQNGVCVPATVSARLPLANNRE